MRRAPSSIQLSASDLAHFLACRHRTALDLAVAHGRLEAPRWVDPAVTALADRGREHERAYVETLRAEGLSIADLSDDEYDSDALVTATVDAIRAGVHVIVQPALRHDRWFGRPDILRRVDVPSALHPWSYEVYDTKLARETRGGTVLQLTLYSELLRLAQGTEPENFHVVTPDPERPVQHYRLRDFTAYVRLVRGALASTADRDPDDVARATYPEPVDHCDVCRWWQVCDKRRRADDHLSLVAGIPRLHTRELQAAKVDTLRKLATMPLPMPFRPRRGSEPTYVRVREQARIQLAGRDAGRPVHELLPIEAGVGLTRLPAPSPGDLFLDLEGDPFAREGGREYLFGLARLGPDGAADYRAWWALTDTEERAAFESLVDAIIAAWDAHPAMHVYHYAPYEPAALKRLMGRHATREAEIDRLLRGGRFVDLYAVVRHGLRASVERYSIKDLEKFYGFARDIDLREAGDSRGIVERALELGALDAITAEVRAAVEVYNRDDCLSARALRDWLEDQRARLERAGTPVPRPEDGGDGEAPEAVDARSAKVLALMERLIADVPIERADRSPEQHARFLLAHMLDWHRRESKIAWWEYFRLSALTDDELMDERDAIAGLTHVARVQAKRAPVDRYSFPLQDTDIGRGSALHLPGGAKFGEVVAFDRVARTLDVKKRRDQAETHPTALFAHEVVNCGVLADALLGIAEDVAQHGVAGGTAYRVARELLLANPPRVPAGALAKAPAESIVDVAVRLAPTLDGTVLAIQGPPGAGKTFTGARMIAALVRAGMRAGVTAVSHKVIRKLLEDAHAAGARDGVAMTCLHKASEENPHSGAVEETFTNADVAARLADGTAHVAGGTAWLWARPEMRDTVDVLFVDEAGQMALANVLAVSHAARAVVLLGDPRQLEQPQQGSHPEGTEVSALEHVLQGAQTMPEGRGLFLPETWRLSPGICRFTSEVFYEDRLQPREGLDRQVLVNADPFTGSGLWVVPVEHDGNQSSSPEEAEVVERVVRRLLVGTARWVDGDGKERALAPTDILVVAPYNAHVALLDERLTACGVAVGTVDRFQGQEAPVVIYAMGTSTPQDAPRGMEFLYSPNRLNVATSRARCVCILVASPRLFEPECQSPRQMQLANGLCRYRELATVCDPGSL